jgi:hypothetical protein
VIDKMISRRFFTYAACAMATLLPRSIAYAYADSDAGPFSLDELQTSAPTYTEWISGVFYDDLFRRLSPDQIAQLGDVTLDVPLEMRGPYPGFVLNIASESVRRHVIAPVRTIRWLDEYCGLTAYLERGHASCNVRTILPLIYDAKLALPHAGLRPPGPFAAFNVDSTIYNDTFVKDVSNKLFNSIIFFLLAHELGHIANKHQGGLSGIWSQMQEREADAYAFDIMAQFGVLPYGLVVLFSAAAMMEGDQSTHPLSGSRVSAAAEQLKRRPRSFIDRSQSDPESQVPRVLKLAHQIENVIPVVDQTERRAEIMRAAYRTQFDHFAELLQRCELPPLNPH